MELVMDLPFPTVSHWDNIHIHCELTTANSHNPLLLWHKGSLQIFSTLSQPHSTSVSGCLDYLFGDVPTDQNIMPWWEAQPSFELLSNGNISRDLCAGSLCLHCLTFFSLHPDSQMSFCWEHRIWGWRSAPLTHDLFTLISVFIKGESIHRKTVISCIIQRTYTHFTELTETHCSETSSVMHYCAP